MNWHDLDVARAAVANPTTSTIDLLSICLAQPSLLPEVVTHPSADSNLLTWISGQSDPDAATAAQARLASMPSNVLPQPSAYQPRPKRKTKLLVGLVSGGIGLLVLILIGVFVILPWIGNSGSYTYAPDFRELPDITVIDAQDGLPSGQSWSTSFSSLPGTGIALAFNSTDAMRTYRDAVAEYEEAVEYQENWVVNYTAGYASGKKCLAEAEPPSYYDSKAQYCDYNAYSWIASTGNGARVGYQNAVEGLPENALNPSANYSYTVPTVPAKPVAPTSGDHLVGINLATGLVAWTFDYASAWEGVNPQMWGWDAGETQLLIILSDPMADNESKARMLVLLDGKTGTVKSSKPVDSLISSVVLGDTVVIEDEDGFQAFGIDLTTEKWASSAHSPEWMGEFDAYFRGVLQGGYLLTDRGYLNLSDGREVSFAKDAGQDGISIATLGGSSEGYVRVEMSSPDSYTYNVSGFNLDDNTTTWQLREVGGIPTMAGGKLIAEESGVLTAYRINGDDLEREWRYSCGGSCWLVFADDSRTFVRDYSSEEVVILNTADGEEIDSLDSSGGLFVGKSVVYITANSQLMAYDLNKTSLPMLWRSDEIGGWFTMFDGVLVAYGSEDNQGLLGIVGLEGDDWNLLEPVK